MEDTDWQKVISGVIVKVAMLMSRIIGSSIEKEINSEGIVVKIGMKVAGRWMENEAAPYISAAVLLAFSKMPVNEDSVSKTLAAADFLPSDRRMLKFAAALHFENKLPYAPAVYFLNVVGSEISAEKVSAVVKALRIEPDAGLAGEVISIYNELESGKTFGAAQERLNESMTRVFEAMSKMLLSELNRLYDIPGFRENVKGGLLPYLAATGTAYYIGWNIALNGKDEWKKILSYLVSAAGLAPNMQMISYLVDSLNLDASPSQIYIAALYFLKSLSKSISITNLAKVVNSVGIKPDETVAGFIINTYS